MDIIERNLVNFSLDLVKGEKFVNGFKIKVAKGLFSF